MPSLPPLAYAADLTAWGVPTTSTAMVAALLDSVSEEVREAAGVPITLTTSTITIPGTWEQYLPLPGGPVRSVDAVSIDGTAVTDSLLRDGRLWRSAGWHDQSVDVEVTYTHGLDETPADIVRLVCMMVAAGLKAAEEGFGSRRGLAYERIDDYQAGYAQGDAEVIDPAALPQRVKDSLRRRFGGGVYVTGSY